jgi:tetratricopeptide (TPR) repeat protein
VSPLPFAEKVWSGLRTRIRPMGGNIRRPAGSPHRRLWIALAGVLALAAVLYGPRLVETLRERQLSAMGVDGLARWAEAHPEDLAARYQLGLARARAGDYPGATRDLLAVLAREPGRADVLNDLGVVYLLQQRYFESLLALQGALAARPAYARATANLGRLHLATKMPYTATRELERAVRLGAADAATLCDLGTAYQQTLNFQSARQVYERVLRSHPRDATAWLGLARTWEGLTDYARAAEAARRARALRPNDPALAAALGHIQLLRAATPAEVRGARDYLAAAVAADPEDAEARYDLGRALRRLGDERGAIAALRHALRIAPDHAGAAYQLSQALIASGRTAEGERIGAAFRRVAARARQQDMLEERVYRQPEDLASRLELARLYAASQRPGLALLQCRQILDAAPDHAAARRLMQALVLAGGRRPGSAPARAGLE